jgi:hypothetical protein
LISSSTKLHTSKYAPPSLVENHPVVHPTSIASFVVNISPFAFSQLTKGIRPVEIGRNGKTELANKLLCADNNLASIPIDLLDLYVPSVDREDRVLEIVSHLLHNEVHEKLGIVHDKDNE